MHEMASLGVSTSPAGRAIRDFKSIVELLAALRNTIKAHRSLKNSPPIINLVLLTEVYAYITV